MSSNPEQISRLSLLCRALIFTLIMALMSGRVEVRKFSALSGWRSSDLRETATQLPSSSSGSRHYLTRY
ncbi:MAG: hypothetical protein WBB29_01790 [Geitlerinemataceae cyanobacterium]